MEHAKQAAIETTKRDEIQRIIRLLRTAMRLLGFTNREIERRLGYTPSYLTRLFSGQIELRFEHIVDIVSAIGMSVDEFFRFAYPDRARPLTVAAQQLEILLDELRPAPQPPPGRPPSWGDEDIMVMMREGMQQILREEREERQKLKEAMLTKSGEIPRPSARPRSKRKPA